MDLSDCSRLLYHWAISPQCDMKWKAGSYVKPVLLQSPLVVKMSKTLALNSTMTMTQLKTLFLTLYNDNDTTNIIHTAVQRRWYDGQHSCLPSSWSGFDSRPTQYFSVGFHFLGNASISPLQPSFKHQTTPFSLTLKQSGCNKTGSQGCVSCLARWSRGMILA